MTAADVMIVVLRPSQLDVETLEEFTDVIDTAHDFNPDLQVRASSARHPRTTTRLRRSTWPSSSWSSRR